MKMVLNQSISNINKLIYFALATILIASCIGCVNKEKKDIVIVDQTERNELKIQDKLYLSGETSVDEMYNPISIDDAMDEFVYLENKKK